MNEYKFKNINIFNWQYYLVLSFAVLCIIAIIKMFINPNVSSDNLSLAGLTRLGTGLGLLISAIWDCNKNRIQKIIINENFLTFEIVKNFKRSKIQIPRKDIISCKINIYKKNNQRINLCFNMSSNKKVKFIDIYHENISLNVVKQLFILEKYITNFSYYVSSDDKYITSFIENGMKYPLKDRIYNALMTISILIGLIITIFCLINI